MEEEAGKKFPSNGFAKSFSGCARLFSLPFFILIVLPLLSSCVSESETKKKQGACGEGEALDSKTRSCQTTKVPTSPPGNSLKLVDMVEDTALLINLTYTDKDKDFAFRCEVPTYSLNLTLTSQCQCVGGYCTVGFVPAANYPNGDFTGVEEFTYFVEDKDGKSTTTIVRVNVSPVDDPPVAILASPNPAVFAEEASSGAITLNYTDTEGEKATHCETSLPGASVSASISTACTCTVLGVCTFQLTGKLDLPVPPGPVTETFSHRVKVNGVWSNTISTNQYQITSVNDFPDVTSPAGATPLGSVTVPVPINEDDPAFSVSLPYYEGDGTTPQNCRIYPGSNTNVSLAGCICNAINPATKIGTCDLTLQALSTTAPNLNKNSGSTFSFKYQFLDGNDLTTWYPTLGSSLVSLTVEPINDNPTIANAPGNMNGATEDTSTSSVTFQLDEGGASDENAQSVSIEVTSLNQTLLPDTNIDIKYGGVSIGKGGAFRSLNDSSTSSDTSNLQIDFTPASNQTGVVTVEVDYKDNQSPELFAASVHSFTITFAPANDDPDISIVPQVCNYDNYFNAPNCGVVGCLSNKKPTATGANITPNHLAQIFFDYNASRCWRSTATSGPGDWETFSTGCPISKSSVETGCLALTGTPLNCMDSGSPLGTLVPATLGSYYYDYTNDKCYKSTVVGSSSGWAEFPIVPSTAVAVCNFNQSGNGSPAGLITPTAKESLYKDLLSGSCYRASGTSSSSWVSFSSSCPVTSKATESNCKELNCMGTKAPRGNALPSDDIIPQATGRYYYQYSTASSNPLDICYKSVATSSDPSNIIYNWVIEGKDFPDMKGNQGGPLTIRDVITNEGGDSSEDSNDIQITIQNLTNFNSFQNPGNTSLLPQDASEPITGPSGTQTTRRVGIFAYKNGTEITGVDRIVDNANKTVTFILNDDLTTSTPGIDDNTTDARMDRVEFQLIPFSGQFGRSEFKVQVIDGVGGVREEYFSVNVYPVGTNHNGWDGLEALGNKVDRNASTMEDISVKLTWKGFSISGSTDTALPVIDPALSSYALVGIQGYQVFRRMAGERFNYLYPLNGSTLISSNTLTFKDSKSTTATIPGPPRPNTVYYYTVVPVDTFNNLMVHSAQKESTIRVVAPPENMAFIHRWLVNQEVCNNMKLEPIANEDYRCRYSGPGETVVGAGNSYYDIGFDMLVDRFEAGCPFSNVLDSLNCQGSSCLGMPDPGTGITNETDNVIYYSRSSGKCFEKSGGGASWTNLQSASLSATQAKATQYANLPPLTNITQERANSICTLRGNVTLTKNAAGTTGTTTSFKLPSRKEQIAYSAWPESTVTGFSDFEVDTLETGFSLNASGKCNSSLASGLESSFTNVDIPSSPDNHALPGTLDSNIRSLITGSNFTNKCVSRYGVQDTSGNVKEWVEDRIYCFNDFICMGVHDTATTLLKNASGAEVTGSFAMTGIPCFFNLPAEVSGFTPTANTCNSTHGCIGPDNPLAENVTPGKRHVFYYNSGFNHCLVSSDTTLASWERLYSSLVASNNTTCPISSSQEEASCADLTMGTSTISGINCYGETSGAPPITPRKTNSYYFDKTSSRCFRSDCTTSSGSACWTNIGQLAVTTSGWTGGNTPNTNAVVKSNPIPAPLNYNKDMKVNDIYYYYWAMDGIKGPCVDADANEACDDTAISGWPLQDESFKAGYFFLPLGLPAHNDFKVNFPDSLVHNMEDPDDSTNIINSLLEIGPSSGITATALHNDYFSVNSSTIVSEDTTNCGAMSTGGSYKSGAKSGRYGVDFFPCNDSISSNGTSDSSAEIGFRCIIRVSTSFYTE